MSWRSRGKHCGAGSERARARSRELVAKGRKPAVVARVLQVNRTGMYRKPKRRRPADSAGCVDPVDRLIVEVAQANPTDGTRMVAALASRKLGRQVNRKRAQRVMREQRLLQRHRPLRRRRRPGFFRVERPDQLWHLDMTSIWVAEHGWMLPATRRSTAAPARSSAGRSSCAAAPRRRSALVDAAVDRPRDRARRADARHRQRLGLHQPPLPRNASASSASPTAAAATATPRARPSSRAGSGSSRSGSSGAPSSRPSTKRERRSPPTSTATTAAPTPASATEPRRRSGNLGGWSATSEISGLKCRRRRGPGHLTT